MLDIIKNIEYSLDYFFSIPVFGISVGNFLAIILFLSGLLLFIAFFLLLYHLRTDFDDSANGGDE